MSLLCLCAFVTLNKRLLTYLVRQLVSQTLNSENSKKTTIMRLITQSAVTRTILKIKLSDYHLCCVLRTK